MAVSKAGILARERYNSKNYDNLRIRVPKGKKEFLQAYVESRKESLNGFINRAVLETLERDEKKLGKHNVIEGYIESGSFSFLNEIKLPNERLKAVLIIVGESIPDLFETPEAKAWKEFYSAIGASGEANSESDSKAELKKLKIHSEPR